MAELEQFCILAKTQKSRACAALVQQVLSHKKIYVFGELLALPSILALKSEEFSTSFNSLELFAYGTYRDYLDNRDSYLELSDVQITKLKQLSVLSLAAQNKVIPYKTLQRELDIPIEDVRSLEDLLIDTVYAGLMNGKLDQRNQHVRIRSVTSRDVKLERVAELIDKLKNWKSRCDTLKANIVQSTDHMKATKTASETEQTELQFLASAKRSSLKDSIDAGVDIRDLEDNHGGVRGKGQRSQSGPGGGGGKSSGSNKRGFMGMGIPGFGGGGGGGQQSSHRGGPGGSSSRGGGSRVI